MPDLPNTTPDASPPHPPGVIAIIRSALSDFSDDDAMSYAAAVAFYAALSLAPLILLLLFVAGLLGPDTQAGLVEQFEQVAGPGAATAIQQIVSSAREQPSARSIAGIVGILTLVVSATGVFAQLQRALNVIWDVKAKPISTAASPEARGLAARLPQKWGNKVGGHIAYARSLILAEIRKRLLSLGMVVTIGFLLMVSMAASAALSAVVTIFAGQGTQALAWQVVNAGVSLCVFTLLFAVMFRYLPDVRIPWRAVWLGAGVTAGLFVVGKALLGLYLGRGSVGSAYGAAGSLVAMLLWVYYAAIIVFLGAEITQAWAAAKGLRIEPEPHAERVKRDPSGEGKEVKAA